MRRLRGDAAPFHTFSREGMAMFYLSMLALNPDEYWRVAAIASVVAWKDRPALISPAY